ncbi:MAG TPA: tRNA (guanosine(37)-N1)-methyltransferase TrmD [Planctomycetota bacterium]|nr:tRNA (guanosine(37)-N1)-methyltransferase TrmD [Planctomycetota bacterium]
MLIDILTLFPAMFRGPLDDSIVQIARDKGLVRIRLHDIRDHAENKHRKVDDAPYGGGPGMVMAPGPVFRAVEAVEVPPGHKPRRILLTPQGKTFNQALAHELALERQLILVCGRYEALDERIRIGLDLEEISIGDFVLSGGELAAMVIVEAIVRLLPEALGNEESALRDSFTSGMLDYPHYTRPYSFRGLTVPDVLLSGDHKKVDDWRREQALKKTAERRPDLLERKT